MTIAERLNKKYGIHVADDSYWHPLTRRYIKLYKIYTADGCPWENGLTYNGLLAECRQYGNYFIEIKERIEKEGEALFK